MLEGSNTVEFAKSMNLLGTFHENGKETVLINTFIFQSSKVHRESNRTKISFLLASSQEWIRTHSSGDFEIDYEMLRKNYIFSLIYDFYFIDKYRKKTMLKFH